MEGLLETTDSDSDSDSVNLSIAKEIEASKLWRHSMTLEGLLVRYKRGWWEVVIRLLNLNPDNGEMLMGIGVWIVWLEEAGDRFEWVYGLSDRWSSCLCSCHLIWALRRDGKVIGLYKVKWVRQSAHLSYAMGNSSGVNDYCDIDHRSCSCWCPQDSLAGTSKSGLNFHL